jgi:hypothetical protein
VEDYQKDHRPSSPRIGKHDHSLAKATFQEVNVMDKQHVIDQLYEAINELAPLSAFESIKERASNVRERLYELVAELKKETVPVCSYDKHYGNAPCGCPDQPNLPTRGE